MRTPRTLPAPVTSGLVALLVVLVGTGCAPLEPKSKKEEGRFPSEREILDKLQAMG